MSATVIEVPAGERALIWTGFPVLGAGVAWTLLNVIAGWVAGLAWAPMQGWFKLAASINEPYATAGAIVVGAGAGLAVSVIAARERVTVTVSPEAVTLARGDGQSVRVPRSEVDSVFLDAKKLVVVARDGSEADRAAVDLKPELLRAAFVYHGYPWREADPHRDEFRLWVPDMPGLPDGANALLAARAAVIAKRSEGEIALLRTELGRLGVVVREEKRQQYWRLVRLEP